MQTKIASQGIFPHPGCLPVFARLHFLCYFFSATAGNDEGLSCAGQVRPVSHSVIRAPLLSKRSQAWAEQTNRAAGQARSLSGITVPEFSYPKCNAGEQARPGQATWWFASQARSVLGPKKRKAHIDLFLRHTFRLFGGRSNYEARRSCTMQVDFAGRRHPFCSPYFFWALFFFPCFAFRQPDLGRLANLEMKNNAFWSSQYGVLRTPVWVMGDGAQLPSFLGPTQESGRHQGREGAPRCPFPIPLFILIARIET